MLLAGAEENIREVIAFPKNNKATRPNDLGTINSGS